MKSIVFLICIGSAMPLFSQLNGGVKTFSQQDYLQKRKSQNRTGWILLGGGVIMMAGGMQINNKFDLFGQGGERPSKGLWLFYLGSASTLASIPFFISAHKNKKRAASVAITNMEIRYPLSRTSFVKKHLALTVQVHL